MSWGTRAFAEKAADQPAPERLREHYIQPAQAGTSAGGNFQRVRDRQRAATEAAHPEKTQQELNIERLMAYGLAQIDRQEAEHRREKEQNRARIEQQAVEAKAAIDRARAAGELQERRCEQILADGRRQEINAMLLASDVTPTELDEIARRLKAQGLLSEPWAWNLELDNVRKEHP
jgi:signal recognition particle GTPase